VLLFAAAAAPPLAGGGALAAAAERYPRVRGAHLRARARMAPSAPARAPSFLYLPDALAATLLAFVGGAVDALGYLGLFSIFTGSITGNVVIGAAAVVPTVAGVGPRLFATAAFVGANAAAHAAAYGVARVRGGARRDVLAALLTGEALALLVAWVAGVAARDALTHVEAPATYAVAALYAVAMGLQNAAVNEATDGFPATTVVTTTLSKIGTAAGAAAVQSAAAAGLLPLPRDAAGAAAADGRAAARADAKKARAALLTLLPPLVGFAAGACAGAALQYLVGFHSTALPLGVICVLVAAAAAPAPAAAGGAAAGGAAAGGAAVGGAVAAAGAAGSAAGGAVDAAGASGDAVLLRAPGAPAVDATQLVAPAAP
jgi:uncharacterized membrane protein YoaK (UPF0700 family)